MAPIEDLQSGVLLDEEWEQDDQFAPEPEDLSLDVKLTDDAVIGVTPIWRTPRKALRRSLRIAELKSAHPGIADAISAIQEVLSVRPDEMRFTARYLLSQAPASLPLGNLLLALSVLVAHRVLVKRYGVVDPESREMSSELFESVCKIPKFIKLPPSRRFRVSSGNIIDVYERMH